MRITAEAKAETREKIIEVAARLFTTEGWESTTTRSIAAEAGIAAGTLFNYFESKEAIVAALMSEALADAQEELQKRTGGDSLEEDLFSLIWAELRSLRRFRNFLPAAAETILSPLRRGSAESPGESLRANHLAAVESIIASHGISVPVAPLTLQLYWTLYVGVFAHWAIDKSSKQEDTLALLDQSLKLFVASLDWAKGDNHERESKRPNRRAPSGRKRRGSKRS